VGAVGDRGPASKDYEGRGITVHWDASRCIHAAECVRRSPSVFDTGRRPWVDAGAALADEIAATVDACPSGALTYTRADGGAEGPGSTRRRAAGEVESGVTVTVRARGPLVVMGPARVVTDDGTELAAGDRHFLCRCGQSSNKPMCDGTHKRVGFTG